MIGNMKNKIKPEQKALSKNHEEVVIYKDLIS